MLVLEPFILSMLALVVGLGAARLSSNTIAQATSWLGLFLCVELTALYLLIDYYSGEGISYRVFAHLPKLANIVVLQKFWPALLVIVSFTVLLVAVCVALKRISATTRARRTRPEMIFFSILTATALILTALFHPFYIETSAVVRDMLRSKALQLPEQFQSIDYLAPPINAQAPTQKNDFVIIFAEGFEAKFLDAQLFSGLAPKLDELIEEKGQRLNGMKSLVLSNWTHAGLTALTCGLSMSTYSNDDDSIASDSVNTIGETCMGDILAADNYQLSFIGGSQFTAEEKHKLFRDQGFEQVILEQELDKILPERTPKSNWGYYDEFTLDFATSKIIESSPSATPQGTLILTLDTHPPGLPSPSCSDRVYMDGGDQLLNAVHCADALIADAINRLLNNPKTSNHTIILVSDHIQSGKIPALQAIDREQRDYLFAVFNSKADSQTGNAHQRELTPLDGAPTILAHLGYQIKTLNLGRNALSAGTSSLAEDLGKEILIENVVPIRDTIFKHWQQQSHPSAEPAPVNSNVTPNSANSIRVEN